MRFQRMIRSLLENDQYKFSMGMCIWDMFPDYVTRWNFKCRNTDVHFTHEMVEEIKEQLKAYCELRFTEEELKYLGKIRWMKPAYIAFLRLWHPRYDDILVLESNEGCGMTIQTYGTWLNTSMYEMPILSIVNEVYFRMHPRFSYDELIESFEKNLNEKIKKLERQSLVIGNFSEFGLRRRLSGEAQDDAVAKLMLADKYLTPSHFVGTSNVYLAKKYGVTPVGTMAHEFIQCVGQGNPKHNPAYSNYYMMDAWVREYGVDNGIALTDCIGTEVFLRDFDTRFATLFKGVRHDSGDPYAWGVKMIKHWEKLGIDPKQKTLLFSDSLNFEKADKLFGYFRRETNVAFGIGTYISNDTFATPLNIVCKVVECNGSPVAKISDDESKGICTDSSYIEYLKKSIKWRLEKTSC